MVSKHRLLLQQCNVAQRQPTRRPAADLEESPPSPRFPYVRVVVLKFDKIALPTSVGVGRFEFLQSFCVFQLD